MTDDNMSVKTLQPLKNKICLPLTHILNLPIITETFPECL